MNAPPGALSRVEARNVSKVYGRHRALFNISLTLERGKVTALLGPNGSGKTTLLTLFSSLLRPTTGEIVWDGLTDPIEIRRAIGLLSHAPLSYPDLSGFENVEFYARLHSRKDPVGETTALLERVGLKDALNRPVGTYSRGMQQRLGLARALIGEPSLVLLDEPFSALDRAATEFVVGEVDALRSRGAIVLLVTHDHALVAPFADETLILRQGKCVAHIPERLDAEKLRARYIEAAE